MLMEHGSEDKHVVSHPTNIVFLVLHLSNIVIFVLQMEFSSLLISTTYTW